MLSTMGEPGVTPQTPLSKGYGDAQPKFLSHGRCAFNVDLHWKDLRIND
jgi:hypothetical protein